MPKKSMGYLLPSGEAYTDEVACMMLFYPAKAEYRRALFGALDYFGTWLAWERDDAKRGQDAARAWAEAVALTRECIEMNTCETMLALLTEIRDNTGLYCCDVVDITDGDQYTDNVEDEVGDVPQNIIDAGYADDAADWDGFYDYKCMISHVMITNMEWQTRKFLTYTDEAGAVVGGIAAVAAIAAAILATGGAALILGIVLAIAGATALYTAIAELGESGLSGVADDLEENHDALACAIFGADGPVGALVALRDKIDELFSPVAAIYLKNLNLAAQLKALYGARYNQQDIAEIMADNGYDVLDYECVASCAETPLWPYDFDSDREGWDEGGDISTTWMAGGWIEMNTDTDTSERSQGGETGAEAETRFGGSAPYQVRRIKARFRFNNKGQANLEWTLRFHVVEAGSATLYSTPLYTASILGWDTWHEIDYDIGQTIDCRVSAHAQGFRMRRWDPASAGQRVEIDYMHFMGE